MSIFNCFRAELQSLFDIKKLTKVFYFLTKINIEKKTLFIKGKFKNIK